MQGDLRHDRLNRPKVLPESEAGGRKFMEFTPDKIWRVSTPIADAPRALSDGVTVVGIPR